MTQRPWWNESWMMGNPRKQMQETQRQGEKARTVISRRLRRRSKTRWRIWREERGKWRRRSSNGHFSCYSWARSRCGSALYRQLESRSTKRNNRKMYFAKHISIADVNGSWDHLAQQCRLVDCSRKLRRILIALRPVLSLRVQSTDYDHINVPGGRELMPIELRTDCTNALNIPFPRR